MAVSGSVPKCAYAAGTHLAKENDRNHASVKGDAQAGPGWRSRIAEQKAKRMLELKQATTTEL